jgi:hypothetical protein
MLVAQPVPVVGDTQVVVGGGGQVVGKMVVHSGVEVAEHTVDGAVGLKLLGAREKRQGVHTPSVDHLKS